MSDEKLHFLVPDIDEQIKKALMEFIPLRVVENSSQCKCNKCGKNIFSFKTSIIIDNKVYCYDCGHEFKQFSIEANKYFHDMLYGTPPLHGPLVTSTDAFKDCTQAKAELLNALDVPMKDVRREYCTLYADNIPYVTVEKQQGVSLNKADYGIPGYSKDELTKCCCEQVKDPQPIKREKKSVAATINDWIFGGPNYRLSLVITAAFCFAFQLSPMYTTQPLIFKIPYKIACCIVLYRQAKKMVEMEEIYENEKKNDS